MELLGHPVELAGCGVGMEGTFLIKRHSPAFTFFKQNCSFPGVGLHIPLESTQTDCDLEQRCLRVGETPELLNLDSAPSRTLLQQFHWNERLINSKLVTIKCKAFAAHG